MEFLFFPPKIVLGSLIRVSTRNNYINETNFSYRNDHFMVYEHKQRAAIKPLINDIWLTHSGRPTIKKVDEMLQKTGEYRDT